MWKQLREMIQEHKDYRKQIQKLAISDLKKTYRGSALGWAWAIIKPAVTIFVYWFAFSFGLRKGGSVGDAPFFLWLVAGIVPWFFMSEMLTQGTDCIKKNRFLVTKMKFPVSTIPTFTIISKCIVHLWLVLITLVIFLVSGYPLTIYLVQLPLYTLLMVLFFECWTMFAAPITTISADFSNLVKSFVTAIFWLSGILWTVDKVDHPGVRFFLNVNPVYFLCNGYRNCLVNHRWLLEQPKQLAVFLVELLVMFLLSQWSYRHIRKEMPDVL